MALPKMIYSPDAKLGEDKFYVKAFTTSKKLSRLLSIRSWFNLLLFTVVLEPPSVGSRRRL